MISAPVVVLTNPRGLTLQVRDTDSEAIAALGLDTFPLLVVLPADGSVVKYSGAPLVACVMLRIPQTCWAVLLQGLFASTLFDILSMGMPADIGFYRKFHHYMGQLKEADAQHSQMLFSICLSGTCSPCRPCKASLCVACAGRLKAADLIDFLGTHAAAAPSKGKAADSSGEADSGDSPGGDESEKAVPQVHSLYKLVFGVVVKADIYR